jgi:hypothetical protein
MTTTSGTVKYAFTRPDQWELYSRELKERAIDADLWQYIDPDNDNRIAWPTKPEKPDVKTYPKKRLRTITSIGVSTRASSSSELSPSTQTVLEEIDPEGQPRNAGEMTKDGLLAYQIDMSVHRDELKSWERTRDAIATLKKWITSTISATYRLNACPEGENLDVWFKELQKIGAIYDDRMEIDASNAYHAMVKPVTKLPRDLNAWVDRWETTMTNSIKKGITDSKKANFWANHLATALSPVIDNWTTTFLQVNYDAISNNTLDYRKVAAQLRDYARTTKGGNRIAKGSFAATLGTTPAEEDPVEDAPEETEPRGRGSRRARGRGRGSGPSRQDESNKRKRGETQHDSADPRGHSRMRGTCKACFGYHDITQCHYVACKPSASSAWRPNPAMQALVEDRINHNLELAELVKRLKLEASGKEDSS